MERREFGAVAKALANIRSKGHCECPGCSTCSGWGCSATSSTSLLQYDDVANSADGVEELRVLCEACHPQHPRRAVGPRPLQNRRVSESFDGPAHRSVPKDVN